MRIIRTNSFSQNFFDPVFNLDIQIFVRFSHLHLSIDKR